MEEAFKELDGHSETCLCFSHVIPSESIKDITFYIKDILLAFCHQHSTTVYQLVCVTKTPFRPQEIHCLFCLRMRLSTRIFDHII